jgi:hypothetical protein
LVWEGWGGIVWMGCAQLGPWAEGPWMCMMYHSRRDDDVSGS